MKKVLIALTVIGLILSCKLLDKVDEQKADVTITLDYSQIGDRSEIGKLKSTAGIDEAKLVIYDIDQSYTTVSNNYTEMVLPATGSKYNFEEYWVDGVEEVLDDISSDNCKVESRRDLKIEGTYAKGDFKIEPGVKYFLVGLFEDDTLRYGGYSGVENFKIGDSKEVIIKLHDANTVPTASFTINPTSGTILTEFSFDAGGSADNEDDTSVLQVRWDWENDGTYDTNYSTTKTITHQYSRIGEITIMLEVKDSEGLTNTTEKTISISNTAPTASFTTEPSSGTTATVFTFDASGCTDNEDALEDLEVRWDWENDGIYDTNFSTTKTTTHQYSAIGTHTIKLEVKDSEGLMNTTTTTISISNTAPTASFTVNSTKVSKNIALIFDANNCSDNEEEASSLQVRWDWTNDGIWDTDYSTDKTINHYFTMEGAFTIVLEVIDSGGMSDIDSNKVRVYTDIMTDIYGNEYFTIQIGTQEWMAENLKVTHYSNGDAISNITDKVAWSNLSTGAYCSYNNNDNNIDIYGLLYNWYAVDDSRVLAPEGWHIPTDEEWKELEMYLGMSQSEADKAGSGYRGTNEGGKLKDTGTTLWDSPNEGATNSSGFSAVPGGHRDGNWGRFDDMGSDAYFWTVTDAGYPWNRELHYYTSEVHRDGNDKRYGKSVRCIKD